jgi:hypothetical protein
MPICENDEQLLLAIQADLDIALNEISERILKIIQNNIINIVYEPYSPRRYERKMWDGGFVGSWVGTKSKTFNTIGLLIFSDKDKMILDPPSHGSLAQPFEMRDIFLDMQFNNDRRDFMDAAIAEGTDYDYFVPPESSNYQGSGDNWWTHPRDYWTPSLEAIDGTNVIFYTMRKTFKDIVYIE